MNLPLRQLQNVATGNYGKFGTQDQNDDLKDEMDNCIVDVCSTEEVEENSENIRPTSSTANSQSPKKKSSLVATFSRMSPFKVRSTSTVAPTAPSSSNPFISPRMQRSIEKPPPKSVEISRRRKLVFDVVPPLGTKCTTLSPPPPPPPPPSLPLSSPSSAHQKVNTSSFKNLSGLFEKCKPSREKPQAPLAETSNEVASSASNDDDAARAVGGRENGCPPPRSSPNRDGSTKLQTTLSRSASADACLPPTPPMFCQLEPNCSQTSFVGGQHANDEDDDDDEADESEVEAALCAGETRKATVSRKEKSLGKLCKRFLLTMGDEAKVCPGKIHLEKVALKMKVEKRRIYDIVNVMEALEAMSKTSKSYYRWNGLAQLPQLMHFLQREGTDLKFPEQIGRVQEAMLRLIEVSSVMHKADRSSDTVGRGKERPSRSPLLNYSMGSQLSRDESFVADAEDGSLSSSFSGAAIEGGALIGGGVLDTSLVSSGSGKNSLAQLCRLFLMVLLCSPTTEGGRRVSLDVASTLLIKDPDNHFREPPRRSRCRRLYDIANVLVAMGLIKKDHYLFGTKKIPMFVYCGPEPDESAERGPYHMREFLTRIGLSAICSVDSMTTTGASTTANEANDASSAKPELDVEDGTEEDDEKYRNIFGDAIPQRRKSSASLLLGGGADRSAEFFRTPKAPVLRRPSESEQSRFDDRNLIGKCGSEESLLTGNPFAVTSRHQYLLKDSRLLYGSGGSVATLMPPLLSVGSSSIPDLTRLCRQQEQQFLLQQQQQQQQQQQRTLLKQTTTSRQQYLSASSSSVSALSTTTSSTSAGSSTFSLSAAPVTAPPQNHDALNPPPSVYRCLEDLIRKRLHHSSDNNNSTGSSGQIVFGNEHTVGADDKENRQPAKTAAGQYKRKKLDCQRQPDSNNGGGNMRQVGGASTDRNRHYLSADNIVKPQPVNPFASGSTSVSAPLFDFSTSSSNEFLLRSIAATKQNAAMPPLPPTVIQPLPASYAALLQTNLLNSISASLRDLNALIQSSSASSIAGSTPLFAPYFVLPQTSMAQPTQEVPTMATSTQCLGEHNRSIGGSGGVMHSVLSILGGDVTMPQQQSGAFSVPSAYNSLTPLNSSSPKAFKPVSSTRKMS